MMKYFAAIAVFLFSPMALAQQHTSTGSSGLVVSAVVLGGICYLTRRRAIGGWLFYFYLGLLLGPVLTLVMAYPHIGMFLQPSQWYDFKLYLLSFLTYMPWFISTMVAFVAALRLLFKSQRNAANAGFLRRSLLALCAAEILACVIDFNYFPENAALSTFSTASSIVMCLYFYHSRRVRYVFDDWSGNWSYDEFIDSCARAREADASVY